MSHLTSIKTSFKNLNYLTKTLNNLNIQYPFKNTEKNHLPSGLKISQSNGHDLEFVWNGENYEFHADLSFWSQSQSLNGFLNKITQQYASEVIHGETRKMGFQIVKTNQQDNNSKILILERYK